MSDHLEPRLAVLESKIDDLEREQLRSRTRLHDLESDRATLRLLVQQTRELTGQIERISAESARKAVELAFKDHGVLDGESLSAIRTDVKKLLEVRIAEQAVRKSRRIWTGAAVAFIGASWWLPDLVRSLSH